MTVIRATKKVLKFLPATKDMVDQSNNALGDWYVNRIVVDRQPLLLIVSELSRLAIVEPARNIKSLPSTLPNIVRRRLSEMHISEPAITRELDLMNPIAVAPTTNRSIVGQLVDFAKAIPYCLPEGDWCEADLRIVEDRLGETPCLCSGKAMDTIWPEREARKLLAEP